MSSYHAKHLFIRMCSLLCCTIFFASFMQSGIAQASPVEKPSNSAISNCSVLQVTLHGSQPSTSICVARGKAHGTSSTVQPHTYATGCSYAALEIDADANNSGWSICFIGSGFANMTDYCGPAPGGCFWNWNDQASSFWAGCSGGTFYTDINGNGGASIFSSYQKGNFPFKNISNDSLSSIYLGINCS